MIQKKMYERKYLITVPNEGTWKADEETKQEFEQLAKLGNLKYTIEEAES